MNYNFPNYRKYLVVSLLIIFLLHSTVVLGSSNPEVLFVLDVSGSMGDRAGNLPKINAAKNAIHAVAPGLSSKDINLGLMHFSGCGNVDYAIPPGPNASGSISANISQLTPGGGTPLAEALSKAGNQLQMSSAEQKRIVLLSDGKESCGGDPVSAVRKFASSDLKVHVIGFDVGSDAIAQLTQIANAGKGEFNQASNPQQLRKLFEELSENLKKNLLEMMRSCVELGGGEKVSEAVQPWNGSSSPNPRNKKDHENRVTFLNSVNDLIDHVPALGSVLTPGPAYAQNLPEWVKNPNSEYPGSQYLTAVGSASSLVAAKNKAKKGLIEIFSQEIEASEVMNQVTREVTADDQNEFHQKFNLKTNIKTQASGELVGAKIEKSKSVFNNGSMTYHALAVLKKSQAISTYQSKFDEHLRELNRSYSAAQRTDDPLTKLRALTKARKASTNALKYKGYLTVLNNMSGSTSESSSSQSSSSGGFFSRKDDLEDDMDSSESSSGSDQSTDKQSEAAAGGGNDSVSPKPAEIDAKLDSVFQDMSISLGSIELDNICPGSRFDSQMSRKISEKFTDIGFRTTTDTSGLIVVDGILSANYTTRGRKSDEAIRWNLTLNLKNSKTGRTFTSINESHVTTGLDKAQVASRTRYEIISWLKDNMNDVITDKILGT